MKSDSLRMLFGFGIAMLFMIGCSQGDKVAESSPQTKQDTAINSNQDDVITNLQKGASARQNNTSRKKPKPQKSATPKSNENLPAGSEKPVSRPNEADTVNPGLQGANSENQKPTSEPRAKKPPKLGPPATPTGKTGTDLGDTLPEITGKDVDGVSFSLSDYDGKVKMVDFWGDW